MPMYDYIYETLDKSTDSLYESSLLKEEEVPEVVHLSHFTTPHSIYHLRIGFASIASNPLFASLSKWKLWILWPFTSISVIATCFYAQTFVSERNTFNSLKLQSWVLPRFNLQVSNLFFFQLHFISYLKQ